MTNALLREAVPSVRLARRRKVLGLHEATEMITVHADTDLNRNKEVVLRFMRLMDGRDFDALDEVLAPDLQFQIGAALLNRQQLQDLIRVFYAAFPDLTHTPEEILSVGDRVVLRATDRATHSGGDFQGIAPTGRRITFGQIAIYRMVDGKIANIWEEADLSALMQQLGAASAMQL